MTATNRRGDVVTRKMAGYFICIACLLCCCTTGRGTGSPVSDMGIGATEYREIQGDIRAGETELAVTGTKLETESRELRSEIGEIGDGIRELESAIGASQGAEQEIGAIIQRVRNREVDPAFLEEWRNLQFETGYSNGEGESSGQR